ncbi:Fe(3+)-hydroxamate ABC transporter permease FhuB (plasmid) [Tistrella mobilis]|uniref:Fe(3+)-hydroxamate ABC transporter permease FhuB n=1 Tax=Tistrella mobilis TaxID=171437 RepID=UPI003555DB76
MMPLPSRPLLWLTLLPLLAAAGLAWAGLVPMLPASGFLPAAGIDRVMILAGTLPRIAVALLAGALLGLAGTVFQQVLRNPVADPSTLGVSAGAHLALALATLTAPSLLGAGREMVALAGSAAAIGLTLAIGGRGGAAPVRVVLAGLIVTLICGAATGFLTVFNHDYLTAVLIWGSGSLVQDGWSAAETLAVRLVLAALAAGLLLRPLALLDLGETGAQGLGVRTARLRLLTLGLAVAVSASVSAAVGVIGFVGLAAPALVRLAGVTRLGPRLLAAPATGAALLWLADEITLALGRMLDGPMLPTGALTAVLGAPLLMVLLGRRGWLPQTPSMIGPSPAGPAPEGRTRRPGRIFLALGLAALVLALTGLLVGRGAHGLHLATGADLELLLPWRWPRVVAALAAGGLLGMAGAVLQRLTGNPLASPEVLGLTSGVILATVLSTLFLAGGGSGPARLAAGAAGAAAALALVMASAARSRFAPDRLLLAGVAIGTAGTALVAVAAASGDPRMAGLMAWMAGSTWGVAPEQAIAAAAGAVLLPALALTMARPLDLLSLGPEVARSTGLAVMPVRTLALLLVCLATAAATTLVGPLSFVGVIAPHLARLAGLGRARGQILAASVAGAAIMVAADQAGRMILAPYQVPAGLMATLIGGPWLIALLGRSAREAA